RQEHVARQKCRVHVLPPAERRLGRTDPVRESDDDPLSRNDPLPRREADSATTHVCTVLPCTAIQRRTGSVLRWELLGFTRDRIQAEESRRRTGTGSSGRYSGNGLP